MPYPFRKDEQRLLEASTRYQAMEGTLLLTSRRLVFYVMVKEYLRESAYDTLFDVPFDAIKSVSSKGYGLSMLIVETDTRIVTGSPRHEFFIIDADRWARTITPLLKRRDTITIPQRPKPQQKEGQRFGKLCLGCMKVVPDDLRVCPNCGEDI